MSLRITVAICTWNRCELLRQTLARLVEVTAQSPRSWELLVVDNNSTDETSAVLASFQHQLPLRAVFEGAPGLSRARNRAIAEARGDYVAWIDDDVLVAAGWLEALCAAIDRWPDAAAFGGPIEPWFPSPPDPDLLSAFPVLAIGFCGVDHGDQAIALGPRQSIHGANMVFSRGATRGLAFNPALGTTAGSGMAGEDYEFLEQVRERGGEVRWVPSMRVKHYVDPSRMTLSYLRRFYRDRGRTVVRRSGIGDVPQLFGVPRWCGRALARHYATYLVSLVTGNRHRAFVSLREFQFVAGVLAEARLRRTQSPATPARISASFAKEDPAKGV